MMQRKQNGVNNGYIWGAELERPRIRQFMCSLNISMLLELGQSAHITFIIQMTEI